MEQAKVKVSAGARAVPRWRRRAGCGQRRTEALGDLWSDQRIFFFSATAATEIYTLALRDALPIFPALSQIKPHAPLLVVPFRQFF